jgi:[protein-PII] uridylyltransferase
MEYMKTLNEILYKKAEELLNLNFDGIFISDKLTNIVDNHLISAFKEVIQQDCPVSLLAIGGYGRKEICPFSDIDIMVICYEKNYQINESVKSFFYRLWDKGFNISHSFRTLNECIEDSKDFFTRTSLIDSRFVIGNVKLFNVYKKEVLPRLLTKYKKDFIKEIFNALDSRHRKHGYSIYQLEPNIKDGIGGLRDVQYVSWLSKSILKTENMDALKDIILQSEYKHFIKAHNFLLKLRICLHVLSKRKNDVLSFEYQEDVSKIMGFKNTKRFFSSEIMMRLFYRKARIIVDIQSALRKKFGQELFRHLIEARNFFKKINDSFYLQNNEIIASNRDIFRSGDKIMEAFYIYAYSGKNFSEEMVQLIKRNFLRVNKKTRYSKTAIRYFLQILKSNRVYETLRMMHDTFILDRFIPEFGNLRYLIIYEPLHKYTVDEHTLLSIKTMETLKYSTNQKFKSLFESLKNINHEVLFLSLLLHDIGKGYIKRNSQNEDGCHESLGYIILKSIMERLNISYSDRKKIELLVKNHTLLSKFAFLRDMDSIEAVAFIADIIENEENLNALYLITYSDMKSLGPNFMTDWKEYLLDNAFQKTLNYIKGIERFSIEAVKQNLKEFIYTMPNRYLISNTITSAEKDFQLTIQAKKDGFALSIEERFDGTAYLTIATKDSPGLFLKIVSVLTTYGLNIYNARLYTISSGLVIDKIFLSNWQSVWWHGLEEMIKKDLKLAIIDKKDFFKTNTYQDNYEKTKPIFRRFKSFIEIDNEISNEYSILEIFFPDRIGLLYDITSIFYEHDLNIISAIVNTEDKIAQDVFYIQQNSRKLDTLATLNILKRLWEKLYF